MRRGDLHGRLRVVRKTTGATATCSNLTGHWSLQCDSVSHTVSHASTDARPDARAHTGPDARAHTGADAGADSCSPVSPRAGHRFCDLRARRNADERPLRAGRREEARCDRRAARERRRLDRVCAWQTPRRMRRGDERVRRWIARRSDAQRRSEREGGHSAGPFRRRLARRRARDHVAAQEDGQVRRAQQGRACRAHQSRGHHTGRGQGTALIGVVDIVLILILIVLIIVMTTATRKTPIYLPFNL